ncbi:MAG: hypothetical protein AVDCRST_MAG65-1470, partial [uncultured Solirubrobacteraceae bacterium]
ERTRPRGGAGLGGHARDPGGVEPRPVRRGRTLGRRQPRRRRRAPVGGLARREPRHAGPHADPPGRRPHARLARQRLAGAQPQPRRPRPARHGVPGRLHRQVVAAGRGRDVHRPVAPRPRPRRPGRDRLRRGRHALLAGHPGLRARPQRLVDRRAAGHVARRLPADAHAARDPRAHRAVPPARRLAGRSARRGVAPAARGDVHDDRDRPPGARRRVHDRGVRDPAPDRGASFRI